MRPGIEGSSASEPAAGPVRFDDATRRLHGRLSSTAERFLDYVERCPEAAQRARYEILDSELRGIVHRLQAWPLFLDQRAQERCAEAMLGLGRLIRAVPHRVFDGQVDRLASFYDLDLATARVMARLLADPEHLAPLVARGDFVDTQEGFQCVEINVAANLGGWPTGLWERLYLQAPPLREFVRREGLELAGVDPLDAFFAHALEVASSAGLGAEGEVNIALAVPPELLRAQRLASYGAERYRSFLRGHGGHGGELRVCSYDDLDVVDGRRVDLEGRRVHVVIELYGGVVPHRLFVLWMAGGVVVLNGPVGRVLNDRRTLALLSEHGGSDLFSEAEREVIRRHLPWTRVVADEVVVFRGRRARLPELLVEERPAMVLKRVASLGGEKVAIGGTTEPQSWRTLVAAALAEGDWIVQERVHSLPYVFQHGAAGCAPHDVAWGFFAFGDRFGGGFLRVLPQGGSGVVNAARGAEDGLYLVVEELETP